MRAFEPLHPTASTASPTPLLGLFGAEGGYVSALASERSTQRRLTVVLNFDAPSRQRMLLQSLVGGLRHVVERHQVITPPADPEQLCAFFKDYPLSAVNVVVVLPDATTLPVALVDGALGALRALPNLQLQIVVAVAESPGAWRTLSSLEHFVAAGRSGLLRACASVYFTLAAAMAPEALLEVDAEDLQSFLGTADEPSFLVHAQWEAADSSLHLHADLYDSDLRRATAILVTPLMAEATRRSTRDILNQWAARCTPGSVVAGNVTVGFFDLSLDALSIPGRLVALCKAEGHERHHSDL